MEVQTTKRQIAYKVKISDLITGHYVKEEGWEPNYVVTKKGNISRANIIGVIVLTSSEGSAPSITIDDGSGQIIVRNFENPKIFENLNLGDPVLIIGRPRDFNGIYIIPEIIKKIENKKWLDVRKKELDFDFKNEETINTVKHTLEK